MKAADSIAVGWNVTRRSALAEMVPEQETHTLPSRISQMGGSY
jgi:hypothetical protein